MVYIYYAYIDEKNHRNLIQNSLTKFSKKYQQKILKYRRWQDAQLSLLGRLLLLNGMKDLNSELEVFELEYTEYNKPFFSNLDLKFNISHSGNIVLCAISKSYDLGVDIELIKDVEIEIFKDQMTIYEWKKIEKNNYPEIAFYEYWTQKEAIIKAHGKGLSIPLKSFEVKDNKTQIDNDVFYVSNITIEEGYTCNIASQNAIHKKDIIINKVDTRNLVTIR
ncbi:4'-phosphopantetheinyl transferase family protein [Tenacibaculum agarivorans]|uniref:4'-phosphopantetheinyl transferase family protein n=1 Tax=Tenacibaculum agarivorans TaxID=1908389 RepID=UPI00094B7A84|nr:4'-phosphopantetheinyl transferase superfamily protein [Tenacibaculum agarivorans]